MHYFTAHSVSFLFSYNIYDVICHSICHWIFICTALSITFLFSFHPTQFPFHILFKSLFYSLFHCSIHCRQSVYRQVLHPISNPFSIPRYLTLPKPFQFILHCVSLQFLVWFSNIPVHSATIGRTRLSREQFAIILMKGLQDCMASTKSFLS